MLTVVVVTFIIGYLAIVFEHPLKLDKTVPALVMGTLCWAFISLGALPLLDDQMQPILGSYDHALHQTLHHHVGEIAEIVIFLVGAMTIVELVDLHKGFSVITERITTTKKSSMLWIIAVLSFFLSAVLDNLTCIIVIVSLLRRIVPVKEERIYFVALAVISANAGGAWSPIGDVTTTMLWIESHVSTQGLIIALFIPSVICAFVPALLMSRMSYMQGDITIPEGSIVNESGKKISKESKIMLYAGVLGLLFVPIFKTITHLPPYVGIILSLAVVWMISEYLHPEEKFEDKHHYSGHYALSRIEMSSILFFLGILMSIAALESLGVLLTLAGSLDNVFAMDNGTGVPDRSIVIFLFGLASAVIDNVPLVAASLGMYSIVENPIDSQIWQFLAYSAGTGGSVLIIGSAAGVAAMGMEKIDFMWYLKNISWLAFIGFVLGAGFFLFWFKLIGM